MDKREELIAYFQSEIRGVSDKEIEALENEIEEIRAHALQEIEAKAKAETNVLYEQELYEMDSDHAIALSHLNDENNRKLMMERESLVKQVFEDVKIKIETFTKSDAYVKLMKDKLSALKTKNLTPAIISVREKDKALLPELIKTYELTCEGIVSKDIELGGFQLQCTSRGVNVDESFDDAIEESKQWFYDTSGLTIR